MKGASSPVLQAYRTEEGFLVRVVGRGTMRESPVLRAFALQCTRAEGSSLVVDLSACQYLDSTFLGCLVQLHKRFATTRRFRIAADPQQQQRVLGPTHLDRYFVCMPVAPRTMGQGVSLPGVEADAITLARHVLDCHRELAAVGGPQAEVFRNVVEQLARELEEQQEHYRSTRSPEGQPST